MNTDITVRSIQKHGFKDGAREHAAIALTAGDVSAVFTIHGCVRLYYLFMEITTAVANTACNMAWIFDSDAGGDRIIADSVNIQAAALGDLFVAELDGTNIVKVTTATGLPHGYYYRSSSTNGTILTPGVIDVTLSATPASGAGTLFVGYQPVLYNSCIVVES